MAPVLGDRGLVARDVRGRAGPDAGRDRALLGGVPGKLLDLAGVLDRYGDAVEADLAFRTGYRLGEFYDGRESLGTLLNLVSYLDLERTSYLQWARANDDELWAGRDRSRKKRPEPTVETFEYTPAVELLAQVFVLAQQQVHATYTHGTKAARKKPKLTHYPAPTTAAARVRAREKRTAFATVESLITFTDEPYSLESGRARYVKNPPAAPTEPAPSTA